MLLRQAQQVSSIHRGTSASSEAASRTKSRKTVQGLRTMSGRGQTEQPTCQIELGLSARNSKHPDAHVAWHTSMSVAEKAPRPPPIRWPRVPDPNRQYSMPRTVTSIEARLRESQRRIFPKRLPDPPRSDGPSRDLRRVPSPNRQFSRSRTGASTEAGLREAQSRIVPKRLPDSPTPPPHPSQVLRRVPAQIGNFPCLGQVSEART